MRDYKSFVLTLLIWGGFSQNSIAQVVQTLVPVRPIVDSIQVVIDGDTIRYKKSYTTDIPLYHPEADSASRAEKQVYNVSDIYPESGIAATGSISRGIQVSSNASVSLQSSMYLKIKGNLSEDYTVSGVLTEKTSPLQPIGNTRRLNDFDRVLIRIAGPSLDASVGDIDLRQRNGQFGKLDRSIEGLEISAASANISMHTALGFGYGKYHLQELQGKDGKQGPYRLSGKNGEKFIIVLAGSETVKVDDKLLQRGQDDDYIIDYNAAEITFTQKRILSANSRISVEFEYVPDIYLASYSFGKQLLSTGFSLGEQAQSPFFLSASWVEVKDDSRNPLGNVDRELLKDIFRPLADSTSSTSISSIRLDSLTGSYRLLDGGILEYAGEGLGDYSAEFSFVGLDRGNYRKVLNGMSEYFVFDTLTGEYSSDQLYFAPQSKTVLSLETGAEYGALSVSVDLGLSRVVNNLYASNSQVQTKQARDIYLSSSGAIMGVTLGDKYLEAGFTTHDAIESLEYYRRWQLKPRVAEEEHLNYGRVRLGKADKTVLIGDASRFERNGELVGQQLQVEAKTNPALPLSLAMKSLVTEHTGELSQQHHLEAGLVLGKLKSEARFSAEDETESILYPSNDHLAAGLGMTYSWSADHQFSLNYDQRRDYRLASGQGTVFLPDNYERWSDRRADWSTKYSFSDLLHSKGMLKFKYREHSRDSSSVTRYYLGTFKLSGTALSKRIRYQEDFLIDEEHIPKFDYHYVEVDTGYGDYSFDPFIGDYIPVSGGRFIRQRLFSDIEEQVRKYENKTRIEFIGKSYGKSGQPGIKGRISSEQRIKLQIDTGLRIQDQTLLALDLALRTGGQTLLQKLGYAGKLSENNSTLYTYGNEKSRFNHHELNSSLIFSPKSKMKLAMSYEGRERAVEYNPLAEEDWISYRPYLEHTYAFSPMQKIVLLIKYSQVEDLHLDQMYGEMYLLLNHYVKIRRRGRLDQKLALSRIEADVAGIPYSVFSGRQPGDNWKYTLNSSYIFSSRFQLNLNYSLQKRGLENLEQFMRIEGRTHF